MRILRLWLAGGFLALSACSARAEPAWEEVVETATEPPTVLADLPFYAGVAGNDEVHRQVLTDMVRKLVGRRDFATLNAMESYFRTSRSRLPGGTWELATYHVAVRRALEGPVHADSPCELKGTDFADAWAAHDPGQPAPHIAKATLLMSYGWCVRGGDAASNVPFAGMATFRTKIREARDVLEDNAETARRDPEYYALMAKLYTAQGERGEAFQRLLDEGSTRFPYYYGIYFEAAWHETPQWGGSYEDVEAIARYAAERTREQDGEGAYARVVWSYLECGCDPHDLPIDRAKLARAMDDLFERYPSDWNAAHFAQIACRLGERELTAAQLARPRQTDWMNWDDPDEMERCRQFAGLSGPPIASR